MKINVYIGIPSNFSIWLFILHFKIKIPVPLLIFIALTKNANNKTKYPFNHIKNMVWPIQ